MNVKPEMNTKQDIEKINKVISIVKKQESRKR